MSARPAGWNAIGRPVSLNASHTGVYDRMVEVAVVVRVRSGEAGLQSERRDATRFVGRALRVLHRERADADEAVRLLRAPVRDPVVVDLRSDATARSGSWIAPSFRPSPGYITDDVDAFGVEHLHPLVRIEPGGVEVLVVPAPAEVGERSRPRCRGRRARDRSPCGPRRGTRRSRSLRSTAGGCRGRASPRGGCAPTGRGGSHR